MYYNRKKDYHRMKSELSEMGTDFEGKVNIGVKKLEIVQ